MKTIVYEVEMFYFEKYIACGVAVHRLDWETMLKFVVSRLAWKTKNKFMVHIYNMIERHIMLVHHKKKKMKAPLVVGEMTWK